VDKHAISIYSPTDTIISTVIKQKIILKKFSLTPESIEAQAKEIALANPKGHSTGGTVCINTSIVKGKSDDLSYATWNR